MRKTVHKVFWAWDYDKEEEWLNEMAAKGLALVSTGFCRYEFEECDPNEYGIQLELLDFKADSEKGKQYIAFVEETGAEHVGTWLRWVYFRKKLSHGEKFRLFSDKDSIIAHLKRIISFLLIIGIFNVWVGMYNIIIGIINGTVNFPLGMLNVILGIFAVAGGLKLKKRKTDIENERMISE
ncbi:MAG: DUF2812 domain-containing protein [Oscillospiraceae bacterium]|nr:DUF2812 domain-containing protein [Oscillospiraceae bacterium]